MVRINSQHRYAVERHNMMERQLKGRDIVAPNVLEVIQNIPREKFLSEKYEEQAYEDNPLPIGLGQTISQPYIVALMTQCLQITGDHEVLEIGTGSGYQTAILAHLARWVYTIERYNELSEGAQTVLGAMKITNVEYFIGDGSRGWPEQRQFDRIMLTAAVPAVPAPLIHQLRDGGLLVAPVGGPMAQDLICYTKSEEVLVPRSICGCRFVKLVGEYGFEE